MVWYVRAGKGLKTCKFHNYAHTVQFACVSRLAKAPYLVSFTAVRK